MLGIHIIPNAEESSPPKIAGIAPLIMLSDDLFLSGSRCGGIGCGFLRTENGRVVFQVRTESNTVLSFPGAETRDLGLGRGTQGVCPKFELPASTINVACLTPQIDPEPHE